jgi:hypothetical protein
MHPQRAAALAFLAVSVTYVVLAAGIEAVASAPGAVVGPRGFPLTIGSLGVLVSLSLLLAPAGARGASAASDAAGAADTTAENQTPRVARRAVFAGDWRRVLALCGSTLLYAAALPAVGFTLSTAGFLAVSFRLLGERSARALVVVPLAIALVAIVLLRGALGAYLPEPLFDRLIQR